MKKKRLTSEDFAFLLGLGLFILFLVLSHPSTPKIEYQGLIFWMSLTLLFLSIAPEYVNVKTAKRWMEDRKGKRVEGLYRRIYCVIRKGEKYLKADYFFFAAILIFLIGLFLYYRLGGMPQLAFGVSYGVFIKALLLC